MEEVSNKVACFKLCEPYLFRTAPDRRSHSGWPEPQGSVGDDNEILALYHEKLTQEMASKTDCLGQDARHERPARVRDTVDGEADRSA
jgi:hypothetical protein